MLRQCSIALARATIAARENGMPEKFKCGWPGLKPIIATVLLLAAMISSKASAQMAPVVPDPITTPELMKYADLLGLSDQQKIGLLPAHDDYKLRYKQFFDRDVVKLRDAAIDMAFRFRRNRFDIPPREELEGLISQYTRLLNTGKSIDRGLFDAIAANLTEDQLLQLQRAKIARELGVHRELVVRMAGEMNEGARIDFSEMLRQLKLPADQIKAADPLLAEYEATLLNRSKEVFEAMLKGAQVVLDTIDRMGIRGMTPEKMMELAQEPATLASLQTTFDEASKPFQQAAHEVADLNHRTFRKLVIALDAESARKLRERYFERAFDDAYTGPAEWQHYYKLALKTSDLSEQQRTDVQAQYDSLLAQEDSMVDAIASELHKWREYRTFTQFQQDRNAPVYEHVKEFKERRETLAASAMETLRATLGESLFASVEKSRKGEQGQTEGQIAVIDGRNANVSVDVQVSTQQGAQTRSGARVTVSNPAESWDLNYAPQPMAHTDFTTLCTAMRLESGDQSVVNALYDEYRAKFDALRASPLPTGENGEKLSASDESKAQKARCDELLALDDHFFADAGVVAVDAHQLRALKWFGEARRRSAANAIAKTMGFIWNQGESIADPVAVLLQQPLDDATAQSLEPMIAQYQSQADAMVQSRLEAARDSRRALSRMQGNAARDAQAQEFAREKYSQANAELRRINRELSKLNRGMFDEIHRQLSPNDAWQYRFAFYQIAYPEVYRDERSADRALEIVLGLPELSTQQRQAISDINSEHRAAYLDICDRMIVLMQDRPQQREDDFSKEAVDRYMELERTRFERSELNARTRMRLRLALAPELAQRLPELNQEW
jgi:hypothetical protein